MLRRLAFSQTAMIFVSNLLARWLRIDFELQRHQLISDDLID